MLLLAPAAAEPDALVSVDCVEVLPAAAPGVLPDVDPPLAAEPLALVSLEVVLLDVEPLALPLADGVDDVLPLVDGAVPPAALLLVVSDALPEPEDWLVVVALWLADTPALTSLLLMPEAEVLGWLGCAL